MKNYYQVLGVSLGASKTEIQTAFWSLAKIWHPDKKSGDQERFKLISEAYNCLSDPDEKARYDRRLGVNNSDIVYNVKVSRRTGRARINHPDFEKSFLVSLDGVEFGAIYTTEDDTGKNVNFRFYFDDKSQEEKEEEQMKFLRTVAEIAQRLKGHSYEYRKTERQERIIICVFFLGIILTAFASFCLPYLLK